MSMEEYFRLLGMDCSQALRRRLDCAFLLAEDADPEHYAKIHPNYLGKCPMHREDGLCALQCEGGEGVLPDVCRLFPRAAYVFGESRCVCSSACEHTVELLMADETPVEMETRLLPDHLLQHARPVDFSPERMAVQEECLRQIRDRSVPLSRRIDRIAAYLQGEAGDRGEGAPLSADILHRIQVALATHYAEHSESVGEACKEALRALPDHAAFASGLQELEARFPALWIWLEKLLTNYMLQECFPYTGREREVHYEGAALCGVRDFPIRRW